jgi:hypothetical protein
MDSVLAFILICGAGMGPLVAVANFPDFQDESPAAQVADEQRELFNGTTG